MSRRHNWDHLYRITAPHLCAGLGIGVDGVVNWSAPTISYMRGWEYQQVSDYCRRKRWTLENLSLINYKDWL